MTTVLQVKVKPGARVSSLTASDDGPWTARVKSLPIEGRANAELVALVAEHFGCSRAAVRIKAGATGRIKLVEVDAG
jgi:uncharacterized protein YggU (UPF0235/DUF167 family)